MSNARKRALVLVLVHVLVALHVAHWLQAGETLSPLEPSEAMEFSKHDLINAGFVFFGLTILSTLVLGRWFCGWACHLVALQDLCLWLLKRAGIRPKPLRSRALAIVPTVAALYMFAWPLVYRIWAGMDIGPPRVELVRDGFWDTFPPWPVALLTFAVCGFAIVYFLGAKGFCTYACPYGALFGFVDRFAPGRIRVTDACEGCAQCTLHCTSNVLVHEEVRKFGMVVDPGCMKCTDCISVCPKNALYFGLGKPAVGVGKPSRASVPLIEELVLAVSFVAAFLVFRGLYGVVPFLLALGWSGILAFCYAGFLRVLRRANASFMGRTLKTGGRLTGAGRTFVGAMAALSVLFVHSAVVQLQSRRVAAAYDEVLPLRTAFLDDPARTPDADARAHVEAGLSSARFLERYGLLDPAGEARRRAWLLLASGDDAGFEALARTLLHEHPEDAALREDLARFLLARGREAEAIEEIEKALETNPSPAGFDRLGRIHFARGRGSQAEAAYTRGLDVFPDSADLHFNLGVLLGLQGRHAEAAAAFGRTLELDPDRNDARENIAGMRAAGLVPTR